MWLLSMLEDPKLPDGFVKDDAGRGRQVEAACCLSHGNRQAMARVHCEQAFRKTLCLASKYQVVVLLKTLMPVGPASLFRQKEEPRFVRLLS